MMIGFDVAPVAPSARLRGDLVGVDRVEPELVPEATRDCSGVMGCLSGRCCEDMIRT